MLYPAARQRPVHIGWGLISIALAFALRFLMQYTYAMIAFWVERATAIEQFSFLLYTFFSGMVAPLTLFPDAIRSIVFWTPFPYLIYVPAALIVGLPVNIGKSIAITAGWCLIFWLLNRILWRQGLRRYSGMGA